MTNTLSENDFAQSVRTMTEFDLPPVMQIERKAYKFPWTEGFMADCLRVAYQCFVYAVDDEIRGYLIYSIVLDEVHLLNVCIAPEYHNKGYGHAFINWLMNHVRDSGSKTLYLEVRASNYAAIHLYETMGFNELGLRPDYYPAKKGREDAQLFACELT
ncbi:ribosomal protein S18-alanine N-acetyltransferase [sulfur-oxidizing endosymbiont of Gigantopelta aegis]|uniref:ribosomal protein S18-alanine N-acetyltransferase n=1 Tax=sulfur-oxidizing endosymbiont of Gigantopelta aegis TaxID=2794934 RepID=UPI001BE4305C|nr:ribosomal protein S18-alanine N-acetyltransferase [sulfur-oxidizing endosymbiont of Gigantopelta aegis]